MNIGQAVEAMKEGHRVTRAGWNGRGMWLRFVPPMDVSRQASFAHGVREMQPQRGYIEMKDAQDWLVPWLASQTDLLAADWEIVPPPPAG